MKTFIINLAAIVLLGATALAAPEVGKPAPDFTLKDSDGNEHKLSDFKGKTVVLEWLNHGCPFVRKHYDSGNMQGLQKKYTAKDVVWLSIVSSAPGKQGHMSPEETNAAKKEKDAAPTAILLDESGTVGRLYEAKSTPEMFIVDADGVLAYAGGIDDTKSVEVADIASSKNYVAQALDELLAGKPVSLPKTAAYGCSVKY